MTHRLTPTSFGFFTDSLVAFGDSLDGDFPNDLTLVYPEYTQVFPNGAGVY